VKCSYLSNIVFHLLGPHSVASLGEELVDAPPPGFRRVGSYEPFLVHPLYGVCSRSVERRELSPGQRARCDATSSMRNIIDSMTHINNNNNDNDDDKSSKLTSESSPRHAAIIVSPSSRTGLWCHCQVRLRAAPGSSGQPRS
jgi:hypothetical protein